MSDMDAPDIVDELRGFAAGSESARASLMRDAADEIDRLRGAIREALDFEAALPAIATVPHKILTDALEAEGGETND